MNIRTASRDFERWLATQVRLVGGDLRYKHVAMRADPFSFMRATYYRWSRQFFELDSDISRAPTTLAVGDLHIENFGTWRDALGRLAWGINDFDEAYPLPYTNDLIRLAVSVALAVEEEHLGIRHKGACRAIIEGYREGLTRGGRPFVIGEEHRWFKPILQHPSRDPGKFWDQLNAHPRERDVVPGEAKVAIASLMPNSNMKYELRHRVAGLGNLGKPRYTAIAQWHGGPVAREAKSLTRSAANWGQAARQGPFYEKILAGSVRSCDPYMAVRGDWIVRRLAPDCRRIELLSLGRVDEEEWLLHAMGFETANVHLGNPRCKQAILKHLARQPKNWLAKAAVKMRAWLMKDFKAWK